MRNTETYPAVVTANEDPETRGRLRVACAALLGDEASELPQWVEPALDWGWFYVPDVGELIEIEVATASSEDESHGQMSIDNLAPKWRGTRYYGNEEGEAPTPVHEDFATNYGKRRGFATPGGHVLIFDDTDGDRSVTMTWMDENGNKSTVACDAKGTWSITTHSGHSIVLDAEAGTLTVTDQNGNVYKASSSGTTVSSPNQVVVDAPKVELGGMSLTEALLLGTAFINMIYNLHTHPTGVGPSGPPTTPAPASVLSTVVFTK